MGRLFFEPLDDVLARTRTAIVVDIRSAEPRYRHIYRELTFVATPVETLFGKNVSNPLLDCQYEQGLVHSRGDLVVSPLVSGSGMEFDVKSGDRVILLIGADGNERTAWNVLRIEPLEQRAAIKRFGAKQSRGEKKQ